MRRMYFLAVISILSVMLVACGQSNNGGEMIHDESVPIEVQLIVPESADPNEEVTFTSIVTQGDDLVEDASEVVYEIWLEGAKEQSEMIEHDEQNNNEYLLTHTFTEEGVYHVQTHVTARGLHRMPTKEIIVGDVELSDESNVEEEHSHENEADVDVEVLENSIHLQVQVDGEPFTNGEVTLEMSKYGEDKHEWLDAVEIEDGKYEVQDIEKLKGTYTVIVHITDEDVHEHVEVELDF